MRPKTAQNHLLTPATESWQYRAMLGGTKSQFSLILATPSARGLAKSNLLSDGFTKVIVIPLLLVAGGLPLSCDAELITFIGGGTTSISSNQMAQIISVRVWGPNSYIAVSREINGTTNSTTFTSGDFSYSSGYNWPWPITIAGPAIIKCNTGLATIRISDIADAVSPSTSVVIPTDATGPVTIILESSADLVNWTAALPGTYGATTTNRFFRVRAVRQ